MNTANSVTGTLGTARSWNGEFYASYGPDGHRSWADAVQYRFISGGGGRWYSDTLRLLHPGDRVWVKVPKRGYVGVARVRAAAVAAKEFRVETPSGAARLIDVAPRYRREDLDDPDRCEYFVAVDWLDCVSLDEAVNEAGMAGYRHTVCRPRTPEWQATIERLKERFPRFDGA